MMMMMLLHTQILKFIFSSFSFLNSVCFLSSFSSLSLCGEEKREVAVKNKEYGGDDDGYI